LLEWKNFQGDLDHLPPERMHDVHVGIVGMYAFRKVICFYTVRMHLVTIMERLAVSLPHNGQAVQQRGCLEGRGTSIPRELERAECPCGGSSAAAAC
jgi:hypothetical protein